MMTNARTMQACGIYCAEPQSITANDVWHMNNTDRPGTNATLGLFVTMQQVQSNRVMV